MPVFHLTKQIVFPDPALAEDGLVAVGGDLLPERLLTAYSKGIFPWYSSGDPILWWYISPRLVIVPGEFHVPKRIARYARKSNITITRDTAFSQVINACSTIRTENGEETWIHPEMMHAYTELHRQGFAHSIECWQGSELVGGLYGIALDRVFFGESMFSRVSSASQFALIALIDYLQEEDYQLVDCQMTTDHLLRFGAKEISGEEFSQALKINIKTITPHDNWKKASNIS